MKANSQNVMTIEENDTLVIYYPQYSKIDLVCGTMPSPRDTSVLLCCEAAFTRELLKDLSHSNIAGDHVACGKLYKGYQALSNTGCFAWYADSRTWEFAYHNYSHCLRKAEKHGGMAFGQNMIIYKGKNVYASSKTDWHPNMSPKNQYRALCELKGKLCIIDSKDTVPYADFVDALQKADVTNAIYLDMGNGWNYSFYRDNNGNVRYIHDKRIAYTTNWITFYR